MIITLEQAAQMLLAADHILVLSHHFPDGDTLGSAAGLCHALRQLHKKVAFRCSGVVTHKFHFLFEGIEALIQPDPLSFQADFIVSMDVADIDLLGKDKPFFAGRVNLCIDHHGSNTLYARHTVLDASAAAVAEILFRLVPLLGAKIDLPIANCIYTGISTDTGGFRYQNTTAQSFRIAAEMKEIGVDTAEINNQMLEIKSRSRLELERRVLDNVEFFCEGRGALAVITLGMIAGSGATEEDLDGISSMPRSIEGVLVGITMREREEGGFKVSMRTNVPLNACEICSQLGGGGHPGAAGCTVEGSFPEAKEKILAVTKSSLECI